jgi:hypothetical protein
MGDLTLTRVLDAQRTNSTLAGQELRIAAQDLIGMHVPPSTVVLTYDEAGQRIMGAALTLSDSFPVPFDTTTRLPAGAPCLLVGGVIAGSVGVAQAAQLARSLGAEDVTAAVLGGWAEPIPGVDQVRTLASTRVTAA